MFRWCALLSLPGTFRVGSEGSTRLESARLQSCSKVGDCAWWCPVLYCARAAKDLCVPCVDLRSLLWALPLFNTVNGSTATHSVLKQHREEEMQYLAMPRWCWVRPGTVCKLCGRCRCERANVVWFYVSPCMAWRQSQGKKGVLQLGDGAEGYPGGELEQLPESQHLPVWQRRK